MSDGDLDLALALSLQELNSPLPSKREGAPAANKQLRVVDESLELSDPNPNIHQLFVEFDSLFFWGRLTASGVAVAWSPRMTLCAGVCSYEGRGGFCSIRLSQPLLKLRSRRDLVETLLHEMIHAFLFVTDNNKDHDGHGPEFLSHMHRINSKTGAKISVYHNFHQEVKQYRQHWWKCDGPCQHRPPYFGFVKRATNRAPSPRDPWWQRHQDSCGGVFRKIKEPEGYGERKGRGKDGGGGGGGSGKGKEGRGNKDIKDLLKRKGEGSGGTGSRLDSFKGRGYTVGGTGSQGGSGSDKDLRAKMLAAAERRQQENVKLRDLSVRSGVKRKLGDLSFNGSPRKIPHFDDSPSPSRTDASDCIIITDTPPDKPKPLKVPATPPPPSVIVLDEEEDTSRSQSDCSPASSAPASSPAGLEAEEFKTCPVCEMSNIPAAIINAHISLCLEAEEQYRVIDDD